jgi:hypothetical protein
MKTSVIRQVGPEDMDDRYSNAKGDKKFALQSAQNKSGNQLIHSVLECDAALFGHEFARAASIGESALFRLTVDG